jgi:hypothetical protein
MPDGDDYVPLLLDPTLFRRLETFAREALLVANVASLRASLNALIVHMREASGAQFGFDSVDTRALMDLMQRTDPEGRSRKPLEQNPIEGLAARRKLSGEQIEAARHIERIWRAFGRHLHVQGRSYTGTAGGKRTRPTDTMRVMGEAIYQEWRKVYRPWQKAAHRTLEGANRELHADTIVLKIVVDEVLCDTLDRVYKLKPGTSLAVLNDELNEYSRLLQHFDPNDTVEGE